jgi:hypothetical protein
VPFSDTVGVIVSYFRWKAAVPEDTTTTPTITTNPFYPLSYVSAVGSIAYMKHYQYQYYLLRLHCPKGTSSTMRVCSAVLPILLSFAL